ncbi:hypothetical protein HU200_025634 [Digitaria exilis]|uniref:Pentatricopeptide repeat-containing protein n=1 Tax=Digitaria exilis TaxID=1010633 RepID=A0A835BXZ9_9POAL|nr:hypothetical protein HU200_025634 [Digitaria exilis]
MATRCVNLSKFFRITRIRYQSKQTRAKSFATSAPTSEPPHLEVLTVLLHSTCSLKCLRALHARLAVAGAIWDTSVIMGLVKRYLSLGKPSPAASLFAEAYRGRPTVYSLNLAVRCFSGHGFHRELLDLYRELCGFGSDNFTFPLVIKGCTAVGCLRLGREVHCRVLRTGHGGNVGVQTALLDMYAKAGQIDVSRRVFDGMAQRDLISWNAMVSGYSLNGCFQEAVEALQEMQQGGMRLNASTLVGIIGMCGGVKAKDLGSSLHALAMKYGTIADESLTSAFISMYSAFDDVLSSRLVFDLQPVKDLVSFNSMIAAYMQHSNWKEAFDIFRLMHCADLEPNLVTMVSILPSCNEFFGINQGESVHGVIIKFGLAEQVSVVSALVSMYSKVGKLNSAVLLFCCITEKNNLVWNSMISGYLVNNEWNMALDMFCKMQIEGVPPDSTAIINVISACRHTKDFHVAKSIHAYAVRNRFESNQSVTNALLAMYADCGDISTSYKLFQKMEVRKLISWNTMISGFAEIGDSETSLLLFCQMCQEEVQFDLVTLIGVISSLFVSKDAMIGESVHSLAIKSGCSSDVSLTNALITMYTNCGIVEAGQKLFDSCSDSTITYNALMSGYRKNNVSEEILPLFCQMVKNDVKPNLVTLLNLLPVCQSELQGKSIHSYAVRNFTRLETPFSTSAICMYSRFNNIEYCRKVFSLVGERNIILWNAFLSACVQCKQADMVVDFFKNMLFLNVKPDSITMLALISACSQLGDADFAACVMAVVLQRGFSAKGLVVNALIDMHSRCGSISFAREVFDSSVEKDSITWGAMINAYSIHGNGEAALDLFSMMTDSGTDPDDITFVSILSACSHSGFVEQGRTLFKSLQANYGITPRVEHYACMVDLLGRTGHLDEAYDIVRSMPFKPSDNLLESLLGACRFHGNSKIGESVGKLLIESEHGKSRSYVMLSNIYASAGKWSDSEQLRADMEAKGLRKDVAVSNKSVELQLERMTDKNIEEANSSLSVSPPKSLQSSVEPEPIEGSDEDYHNNSEKTVRANFEAPMHQDHPMILVLAEKKSNFQDISVDQKVSTGDPINLSPKVDCSKLPSTNEVHDGNPSSSSKDHDGSDTMKSDTASSMFGASMQQDHMRLTSTDEKGDLQEISVEQKVTVGDHVALLPKADSYELPSTNEVPGGFPTPSSDAYESKEAQDGCIKMEALEVNVCAASQSLLRLNEGVQDGAYCIESDKVTCGAPPAILKKVEEDKPRTVSRFHKRQMSLGHTQQKVPAPLSRSSTGKYLGMDHTVVDTTTPIESVKVAASKFGGSINWKTRRSQTAQESNHIILELDKLKNEISECKCQAEAAEETNLAVFSELERTKKIIDEMEHVLERQQAIEVDAKEDLEFFQFILQEMDAGVACDDSIMVEEKLNNIQERHKSLVAKVMLVKDDFRKVQEEYDSLLIETDISVRKAQRAFAMSIDAKKQVEELTIELQRLKELFDLAQATWHDAEEHKKGTLMARDEDCLAWEKDLRQAEKELNQISMYLSSVQELQSKIDASSSMLLNLKNELATCLEAKLIEEAREQEGGTHKSMQEEAIILSRNELEEHRKSIAKVTDELCSLKATAATLKSELNKEKAALAAIQQKEAMASITIQSLKVEIKLSQQELEAVRAKEKERRDKAFELPKVLQDAAKEADESKSVAAKAQEELKKTKEEVEQVKAALGTMQFRLEAVLREAEVVKESEKLTLNASRALLVDTKVSANTEEQVSSQMITIDLDDYTSLIQKVHHAEELARKRTAAAIAQIEAAKEPESHTLSALNETYKALEERKQALLAATEQANRATEGKLAMEQELRKWREEHGRRRKAGEQASKSEAKSSNNTEIIVGDTKCRSKEDSCAGSSVHPVSDVSGRSSPNDLALQVKRKKAKKLSFFPRVIMFLGRRRLKAAK